ncbi:MAG: alpha-L-arabinofuranosidase C-terminal domain-containing protein [Armatimonadota bacterium]
MGIKEIETNTILHVKANEPSRSISPLLYGIFYEDINHAADGGIYAELIRNRSFEDTLAPDGCTVCDGIMRTPGGWETKFNDSNDIPGWNMTVDAPAEGLVSLDSKVIINDANPRSLKVDVNCSNGGSVSIANEGYWGIRLDEGAKYKLSFFAKTDRPSTSVTASLQSADGKRYASQTIDGITGRWDQYECILISSVSDKDGRLVITTADTGALWLDVVSLFPEATWKRRDNGLRADLMQMLADMKPAFVRFPGGCFVEGITPDTAFQWKNTIGPIHERKGHWNLWGYRTTNGLGYHEYLQMCEDLHAEPMYVFNCGMTCQARKGGAVPAEELDKWIQDALDAVEYANGPVESTWGSERAKAGHPEPFNMRFMEIGNENFGPDYEERYKKFYDALKDHYPEIRLITNAPVSGTPMEILDEHYYSDPKFFLSNWTKYDTYDRQGPEIYVGEYACTDRCGQGNLAAALGEAAFMMGMERNADVVKMSSYAPLFVNLNDRTWNPDAICFDNSNCYGTPSYHVQTMFAQNRPDETLAYEFDGPNDLDTHPSNGCIGLSTWATTAEYKDIRVVDGDAILYDNNFNSDTDEWTQLRGEWVIEDGTYRQITTDPDTCAIVGDAGWTNYTLTLKARKLEGSDGFIVMFRVKDQENLMKWNIGAFSNALHTITAIHKGKNTAIGSMVMGSIETNRWYNIRVEVNDRRIRCFLDGALIHDVDIPPIPIVTAVAGRIKSTGEIILKVVNTSEIAQEAQVEIDSIGRIAPHGTEIILTSASMDDENSITEPMKIVPVKREADGLGISFIRTFEPNSLTILKLKAE